MVMSVAYNHLFFMSVPTGHRQCDVKLENQSNWEQLQQRLEILHLDLSCFSSYFRCMVW